MHKKASVRGIPQAAEGWKGGEIMWRMLEFWQEEDAVGVVEIILILVVLIGLVIIFKQQLVSLVNDILDKITSQSNSI